MVELSDYPRCSIYKRVVVVGCCSGHSDLLLVLLDANRIWQAYRPPSTGYAWRMLLAVVFSVQRSHHFRGHVAFVSSTGKLSHTLPVSTLVPSLHLVKFRPIVSDFQVEQHGHCVARTTDFGYDERVLSFRAGDPREVVGVAVQV